MVLTEYKSPEEIRHSLGKARGVVVFSCSGCANMNEIGGRRGLKFMKKRLSAWGYSVVAGATPPGICMNAVMENATHKWIQPNRSKVDALLAICCAAGIKNAAYFNPDLKVVAAADPMGVECLLPHNAYYEDAGDYMVAHELCLPCGSCVLSFTTGICPLVACPAKSKYGYCKNPPYPGNGCTVKPDQKCVWAIIEKRGGDLEGLGKLKEIHENPDYERIPSIDTPPRTVKQHTIAGYCGGRSPSFISDLLRWVR